MSANAADVVPGSDVVLICAPANAHPALLRAVAPHVDRKAAVGALYAQGGFDWAARKALGDKVDHLRFVFGLQNIPWICKAVEYGKRARYGKRACARAYCAEPLVYSILGPKDNLWVAASPPERAAECTELITSLFDIPARPVPNFLNLTLTPSNQIIHPARFVAAASVRSATCARHTHGMRPPCSYFGIFRDWDGRKTYTKEVRTLRAHARTASFLARLRVPQAGPGSCRLCRSWPSGAG